MNVATTCLALDTGELLLLPPFHLLVVMVS
jgi:hypothetical protein